MLYTLFNSSTNCELSKEKKLNTPLKRSVKRACRHAILHIFFLIFFYFAVGVHFIL